MWGIGDSSAGWDERAWNRDGRARLTTINMTTYEVTQTIELSHGERAHGHPTPNNTLRYYVHDLALDEKA